MFLFEAILVMPLYMDLGGRKLKILNAIVESYVKTGEPIASKTLSDSLDFSVSSATIRNEMAELVDLGLLEQPHTSAGRIPSQLGYRIYVDDIMKKIDLPAFEQELVKEYLLSSCGSTENLLEMASKVLANISNFTAISTSPVLDNSVVKKIEIIQINKCTGIVLLLTSTGIVKDKTFLCDYELTSEIVKIFKGILNEKIVGLNTSSLTPAFIQTFAASLGEISLLMPSVLLALSEAASEAMELKINLYGQENLLFLSDMELINSRKMLKFLSDAKDLKRFLLNQKFKDNIVLIGKEANHVLLQNSTIILSKYYLNNSGGTGMIGIFAPTRVNYAKLVPLVEYVANITDELFNKMLNI